VRGALVVLALSVLIFGFVYPGVVTVFAQLVTPGTANGSLLTHNGTVVGSSLIAQNLSTPYLFWERPSLIDYNVLNGSSTNYGPSDPALAAWFNETIAYMALYGNWTVNASVPMSFAANSGSGLDPDLVPEAVLVQMPRVAANSGLSNETLLNLINGQIVQPYAGFIGTAYINVLKLDLALLPLEGR
jgi:K+-transporting ATPase ATPase C chain